VYTLRVCACVGVSVGCVCGVCLWGLSVSMPGVCVYMSLCVCVCDTLDDA